MSFFFIAFWLSISWDLPTIPIASTFRIHHSCPILYRTLFFMRFSVGKLWSLVKWICSSSFLWFPLSFGILLFRGMFTPSQPGAPRLVLVLHTITPCRQKWLYIDGGKTKENLYSILLNFLSRRSVFAFGWIKWKWNDIRSLRFISFVFWYF